MLGYRAKPGASNLDVWRKVRHPSRTSISETYRFYRVPDIKSGHVDSP